MPNLSNIEPLLLSLRRLSPMPPDEATSQIILRAYQDVLAKIMAVEAPPPSIIEPLYFSFGPGEGRGAFRRACRFVRTSFPEDVAGPALVRLLETGGPSARRWACETLGDMTWLPSEEALKAALEDESQIVRQAASEALRALEASKPPPEERDDEPDPLFEGLT